MPVHAGRHIDVSVHAGRHIMLSRHIDVSIHAGLYMILYRAEVVEQRIGDLLLCGVNIKKLVVD
jgi:hypothetical protein